MLQLPPRPAKADTDVSAAFVAAGAHSGAEQDPLFPAIKLRYLPDAADRTDAPPLVREHAHHTSSPCSDNQRRNLCPITLPQHFIGATAQTAPG